MRGWVTQRHGGGGVREGVGGWYECGVEGVVNMPCIVAIFTCTDEAGISVTNSILQDFSLVPI